MGTGLKLSLVVDWTLVMYDRNPVMIRYTGRMASDGPEKPPPPVPPLGW